MRRSCELINSIYTNKDLRRHEKICVRELLVRADYEKKAYFDLLSFRVL